MQPIPLPNVRVRDNETILEFLLANGLEGAWAELSQGGLTSWAEFREGPEYYFDKVSEHRDTLNLLCEVRYNVSYGCS